MRLSHITTVTVSLALSVACATRSAQTRTTAPPAGPVQAGTTATDVIPSGTEFTVRTNETISSTEAGRNFSGQLAQNIINANGQVLAQQGAPVMLTVYSTESPGTVGTASLQLGVSSITINGHNAGW